MRMTKDKTRRVKTDVLIIGSGIAGCTAALELASRSSVCTAIESPSSLLIYLYLD